MSRQWMRRRTSPPRVCPPSHDTYGELAEEIQQRVRAAVAEGKTDPMMVHAIADELTQEGRIALLRDIFGQLDEAQQWELLAEYFDDDTIRRALQEEHDREAARANPDAYAALLAKKTRRTGRFDLDDVLEGMVLVVHTYNMNSIPDAAKASKLVTRNPARSLRLALDHPESMYWRVLDDRYDADRYYAAEYVPGLHSHIFLGCPSERGGLVSLIFYGAPVYCWQDSRINDLQQRRRSKGDYPQLGVGRCLLNDVEMFHDPASVTPDSEKDDRGQDD